MKKYLLLCTALLLSTGVFAQNTSDVAMDNAWITSGKMYVVVLCVLVLFATLLFFLFGMDKKLKKIEKEMTHKI